MHAKHNEEAADLKEAYQDDRIEQSIESIDTRCQTLFTQINRMTKDGQNIDRLTDENKGFIKRAITDIRKAITGLNNWVSIQTDDGPRGDVRGYEFASMMLFDTSA